MTTTSNTLKIASDWRVLRIRSWEEIWYITRDYEDFSIFSSKIIKDSSGRKKRRAVFFRNELNHLAPKIERLQVSQRKTWLREVILIKESLEGAVVSNIKISKLNHL